MALLSLNQDFLSHFLNLISLENDPEKTYISDKIYLQDPGTWIQPQWSHLTENIGCIFLCFL